MGDLWDGEPDVYVPPAPPGTPALGRFNFVQDWPNKPRRHGRVGRFVFPDSVVVAYKYGHRYAYVYHVNGSVFRSWAAARRALSGSALSPPAPKFFES